MGRRLRGWWIRPMACLGITGLALMAAAGSAEGAATITYPTSGSVVHLDRAGGYTIRWTMPPGEQSPTAEFGTSPGFYSGEFDQRIDGCNPVSDFGTSCRPEQRAFETGQLYAVVGTWNSDNTDHFWSPPIAYRVAPSIGMGSGPEASDRFPGIQNEYAPNPPVGRPNSYLVVTSWVNAEQARVNYTFTLRHGGRVLRRIRRSTRSDFEWTSDAALTLYHIRGIRAGTRITCAITVKGLGLTLRRTVRLRVPPV